MDTKEKTHNDIVLAKSTIGLGNSGSEQSRTEQSGSVQLRTSPPKPVLHFQYDFRSEFDKYKEFRNLIEKDDTVQENLNVFIQMLPKFEQLDGCIITPPYSEKRSPFVCFPILEIIKLGKLNYLIEMLKAYPQLINKETYPNDQCQMYHHHFQTPLKVALVHGQLHCAAHLVLQGASLDVKEYGIRSYMDYAKEGKCEQGLKEFMTKIGKKLLIVSDEEYVRGMSRLRSLSKY